MYFTRVKRLRFSLLFLLSLLLLLVVLQSSVEYSGVSEKGFSAVDVERLGSAMRLQGARGCEAQDVLCYVPQRSVRTWGERDFLVVAGIATLDTNEHYSRRQQQRETCWHFSGVASRSNNFNGLMLVLYVMGRHPSHGYAFSQQMKREAAQWHDMLALPLNEHPDTAAIKTRKNKRRHVDSEFQTKTKLYMWLEAALRLFPRTRYVAKSSDDVFLRVPQYLADLRSLPRHGLYWGAMGSWPPGAARQFHYAAGFLVTLSQDVAEQVVSHEPHSKAQWAEPLAPKTHRDDVMIGRVLHNLNSLNVTFVSEPPCRFHTCSAMGRCVCETADCVASYPLTKSDFEPLFDRFKSNVWLEPASHTVNTGGIVFPCASN